LSNAEAFFPSPPLFLLSLVVAAVRRFIHAPLTAGQIGIHRRHWKRTKERGKSGWRRCKSYLHIFLKERKLDEMSQSIEIFTEVPPPFFAFDLGVEFPNTIF